MTLPPNYFDDDEDLREGKNWPPEEDCPHCPGHYQGPHKMDCAARERPAPLNLKGSDLKK